jgi:hypothetical protein
VWEYRIPVVIALMGTELKKAVLPRLLDFRDSGTGSTRLVDMCKKRRDAPCLLQIMARNRMLRCETIRFTKSAI